jgi:hypothetical protein
MVLQQIGAKVRADAQQLVITRLLDCVHDPLAHFSRLQRIHHSAWSNDNPSTRRPGLRRPPVVDLLGSAARGLFVHNYDVLRKIISFRHGF